MSIWTSVLENKRNSFASALAGSLFSAGWWFIIDVASRYPSSIDFPHPYHLCGLAGFAGCVLVNIVPNSAIRGPAGYSTNRCGPCLARFIMYLGFMTSFGSIISSSWILFAIYLEPLCTLPTWPGVGLFLQTALIFASSMVYKFGRVYEDFFF